jgi:Tim17/Tim22/Tim23/Pmp24 family
VLGGNFGVWGGMFSCWDCAFKGIRQTEDPYNAIAAGFMTGGSLAIRGGYKAARNSAIMCAVFLGVIEGVGIAFQRMMADNTKLEVSLCRTHPTFKYLPAKHQTDDGLIQLASSSSPIRAKGDCLSRV